MDFIFYPGCLISYRFPYIEKATRILAKKFGVNLVEPTNFTCCPDPQGILSYNEKLWILTAARNLALAEKAKMDVFTICNGCYSTFRKVSSMIKEDLHLHDEVNTELAKVNLQYHAKIRILHIHELFLREIGLKKLKTAVKKPLSDLNVAVHYGCHLTRPSTMVEFNDHRKPVSLEQLIEATEARVVPYEEQDMCCGGSLNLTNSVDSMRIMQKKIMNIAKTDANCIVVVCPYCYLQFEVGQLQLKKQNIQVSIPVLHLSELLLLSLGVDIEDLLQMHKIKPTFPVNPYDTDLMKEILEEVSLDLLKNCARCRACSKDCSLVMSLNFDPLKYVDLIVEGRAHEAIQDEGIWKCLNCFGCLEKCPQRMGLAHFFMVLRNTAIKHGYIPSSISAESKKFLEDGVVTGKRDSARKRLDLPLNTLKGIEDLKQLLKKNEKLDVEI